MPALTSTLGGYRFLAGIEPYSSGVVAEPGFEIVHVTLQRPVPYREGFARIDAELQALGRPRNALCAIELRSPAPFSRTGFIDFNRDYCAILESWGLLVDGRNPIARTNVAPERQPPGEPCLYGFSYTHPAAEAGLTFVVAGAGDMGAGSLLHAPVIREGETSPDAMREKARHVLGIMSRRLEGLGASWDGVAVTEVYTVHPVHDLVDEVFTAAAPAVAVHGIRWHYTRPPIEGLEFEMDVRGVRTERLL
jgi:hypothetical protein